MKKTEVIIGMVIACIVFIAMLFIHTFVMALPSVYVIASIIFSVLLFSLCLIGDKKRRKQENNGPAQDK